MDKKRYLAKPVHDSFRCEYAIIFLLRYPAIEDNLEYFLKTVVSFRKSIVTKLALLNKYSKMDVLPKYDVRNITEGEIKPK
jgi:hypothetical protein